ncbi:hypothetical protein B0H10DRAFT_2442403, partial [Mycena sp. CBHHK59/15]
MIRGVEQKDPILGHFCSLLTDMPQHFDKIIANLMILSNLNFITSMLLEETTRGMTLHQGVN